MYVLVQVLVHVISFNVRTTAVCQLRHDVMVDMTVKIVQMKQTVVSGSKLILSAVCSLVNGCTISRVSVAYAHTLTAYTARLLL